MHKEALRIFELSLYLFLRRLCYNSNKHICRYAWDHPNIQKQSGRSCRPEEGASFMVSPDEKGINSFFALLRERRAQKAAQKAARAAEAAENASAVETAPLPDEPPEPQKPPRPPFTVPEALLKYRQNWREPLSLEPSEENYRSFLYAQEPFLPEEFQRCFQQAERLLKEQLERRSRQEGEAPPPLDGQVLVFLSEDKLRAWILLLPPLDGGSALSREQISAALEEQRVSVGIDEGLLSALLEGERCFQLALAAAGTPPGEGKDGWIEEVIPSTAGHPHVNQTDGSVDYKNLNWIIPVKENDILCRIHLPEDGAEGKTVTGETLKGKNGARAMIPEGVNTQLDKENLTLISKTEGQVFYENGRYRVKEMLSIEGDVDLSTGNLQVTGSIHIRGNVREGFTVQASGDINVEGMAEGAVLIAGGSIFVKNGMSGNARGRMEAGGDIKCQYLENCTATALGNVYASSIINSNVSSEGEVQATSGHGAIVGGSVTALSLIRAKIIGNKTGRNTVLTLGKTSRFREEKHTAAAALEQAEKESGRIQEQLSRCCQGDDTSPEIVALLKSLQLSLAVAKAKESKLQKEYAAILEKESRLNASQIQAEYFYPVNQVTIGHISRTFFDDLRHCRIYKSEGEIKFAAL